MATDRPRPGGLWRLGARTAFPGRLVVVAGRVPTSGHFVMLVSARQPEERLNDLPVADHQIHWFDAPEPIHCITAVAPVPVLSDDLERRAAVVTRGTHDRIVAALLSALVPAASASVSAAEVRDTPTAWEEEVAAAAVLHELYHERVFAADVQDVGARPVRSWIPLLTGVRLRRIVPQAENLAEVLFAHDDVVFAAIRGRLDETHVELEIDLPRAGAQDVDAVRVELFDGDDILVAVTIPEPGDTATPDVPTFPDRVRRELDVAPEKLVSNDLSLRVYVSV